MDVALPEHWKQRLENYVLEKPSGKHQRLSATDFQIGSTVQITFPDGSLVQFRFAFHLVDEEREEIAVFTEHCGHHLFPSHGVQIASSRSQP